jgi:hypothetical protein
VYYKIPRIKRRGKDIQIAEDFVQKMQQEQTPHLLGHEILRRFPNAHLTKRDVTFFHQIGAILCSLALCGSGFVIANKHAHARIFSHPDMAVVQRMS